MMSSRTARRRRKPRIMRKAVAERLQTCGLELHPEKTKVVYCKDLSEHSKAAIQEHLKSGHTFRRNVQDIDSSGRDSSLSQHGECLEGRGPKLGAPCPSRNERETAEYPLLRVVKGWASAV
jgi:hypothetical protein